MGDHSIDIAINSGGESSKPCIFKVPEIFRRHNPKSFTPNSFSFGPLHHKQEYLIEPNKVEKIKQLYLNNLLTRQPTPKKTREDLKRSILEVEEKARQCYDVPLDHLSKDGFVDMLVLDGCFIIELLRRSNEIATKKNDNNNNTNTIDEDDPVFSVSWVLQVLHHDLILLENQIPWFVLECLFEMTSEKITDAKSLADLALDFFAKFFSVKSLPSIPDSVKSNHILDLIRNSLVSSIGTEEESMSDWKLIPTATSLKESGITFKTYKSRNLLDIKFVKHGVLEIPPLFIQETTCQAFRNLISYEQCYPNCEAKITSYTVLLNNLINTTKDIEVLCEASVIDTWLNPNDTLEFFKNIYTDTYVKKFYYVKICQQVKEYTDRLWPKARAAIVRNHFADPFLIASEIVAGIVVILTILQTYCALMEYNKKDSSHSPPPPS